MIGIWILLGIGAVAIIVLVVGFGLGFLRVESVALPETEPAMPPPYDPDEDFFSEDSMDKDLDVDTDETDEDNALGEYDYFDDGEDEMEELALQDEDPTVSSEPEDLEFDRLSNLKSGRGFLLDCQRDLNTAREHGPVYAAACFDLDRFRFINSLKGANIGDYVLSRISQELPAIFPDGSLFTRQSADHFAVLFPLLQEGILEEYAEQLKRLSDRIRDDIGAKSGLRISVGFAVTTGGPDYDIHLLLQRANLARHCQKMSKTEAYSLFDSSMVATFLYGESAMDEYAENQYDDTEYVLYFQPLYDLYKGRVLGCETMARWSYEDGNYPDAPITPDNSKLPTNNLRIFYQVCRWISRWRKAGKDVSLGFVTLPATDLFKEDVDHYLAKCLNAFQLHPKNLVVQVDVGTAKLDWNTTGRQLGKLKELGIKTALFGIDRGFSALDLLEGLPLDYIKLHKSFVHKLDELPARQQQARDIIALAKRLNLQTVFEGVDQQNIGDMLSSFGAHLVEGRYAGDTCEPDDFISLIHESKGRRTGNTTVILDELSLTKGDYNVY